MTSTTGTRVGALDYYEAEIRRQLLDELPGMAVAFATGPTERDRLAVAKDADVLLVGWSPVSAEVIRASPRLRLIQKMGVGVDRIDLATAQERDVRVLRAAGINADAVAEMTILLMLAVLRELPWAVSELRSGRFQKENLRKRTVQLAGQRVGLIGFGHIGTAVATRLQGFGVEMAYYDTRADVATDRTSAVPMALEDLLAWSDIVSLHTPLVPETRYLLNRARIGSMRPGAVVINTARGGLIDEDALCDAITDGRLRGAGLDVTAEEPIPSGSRLLTCDRVIITPHMGGAVASNFNNVARRARANILAFFAGTPIADEDIVC
jgi:phosphoglycerate dehydrogenase-like enzyme